jgi:hypothetical protein
MEDLNEHLILGILMNLKEKIRATDYSNTAGD